MKYCIIRQVAYRLPGTTRIVWANVLCEREGLTLLHVPQFNNQDSHSLVVAQENAERLFEAVGTHTFGFGTRDMNEIGAKLRALARRVWEMEMKRAFEEADE